MSRVDQRVKKEVVYSVEGYMLEENLQAFVEDFSRFFAQIPTSRRNTAIVTIEGTDGGGVELTVSYTRLETKEERKKRLDALKKARKMGQEAAKKARFAQYERLKAEFEQV